MSKRTVSGIMLALLLTSLSTIASNVSLTSASPQTNTWTNMNPTVRPPARFEPAMTHDSENGIVVLFGGSLGTALGDTWVYNYTTNTWTNMNPSVKPSPREESGMAYDSQSDRIILFGGNLMPGYSAETWAYDYNTNTWINMNPSSRPSARTETQMTYDSESDRVIIFGGAIPGLYLDDTWAYDFNTNTWINMNPSVRPLRRTNHAIAYDSESDKVILFGGWNEQIPAYLNDTWAYDFNTNTWINMNPSVRPSARSTHAMVYDSQSDKVILFGGWNGTYLNETWTYDFNTNTWTNMNPSVRPSSRGEAPMAYDSQSDRAILFGGPIDGTPSDETWAYYLDVAAPIQVHDIAIISVVPSATEVYVGQIVSITVTFQNQGNFTETFNVTCKYELEGTEHVIAITTVNNLAPQANTSLVFSWMTIDVTNHIISAYATPVLNETDTADNTFTGVTIKVKMLGDINGDEIIDIYDCVAWGTAFGSQEGELNWNPQADLYPDGIIDVFDGVIIGQNFGKTA